MESDPHPFQFPSGKRDTLLFPSRRSSAWRLTLISCLAQCFPKPINGLFFPDEVFFYFVGKCGFTKHPMRHTALPVLERQVNKQTHELATIMDKLVECLLRSTFEFR